MPSQISIPEQNPTSGISPLPVKELEVETPVEVVPPPKPKPEPEGVLKVSALSLSSIKHKRKMAETQKASQKKQDELPTEAFSETDMLLMWNKFAQRLSDSGQKIMAAYMQINDPKLQADGFTIKLELTNGSSKVDFDNNKLDLLGYLRGKLHNHDIVIETHVNENVEKKFAFTPEERYERLKAINPALDLLRKTFDLDI